MDRQCVARRGRAWVSVFARRVGSRAAAGNPPTMQAHFFLQRSPKSTDKFFFSISRYARCYWQTGKKKKIHHWPARLFISGRCNNNNSTRYYLIVRNIRCDVSASGSEWLAERSQQGVRASPAINPISSYTSPSTSPRLLHVIIHSYIRTLL